MKAGLFLYNLGILGMFGLAWLFLGAPAQQHVITNENLLLFGFPILAGLCMVGCGTKPFFFGTRTAFHVSHVLSFISILWLILWCFTWLAVLTNQLGDQEEMYIKHTAYLHLFGVGFSMAGYASGWIAQRREERTLRFLMSTGWAVSYMAWFNLLVFKILPLLWAPAVGGLLVVLGAFLISRDLKSGIVTEKPQA